MLKMQVENNSNDETNIKQAMNINQINKTLMAHEA